MYYTIVLVVAVILLIVGLTIVGMTITGKKSQPFPEFQNTCPDYWFLEENVCYPPESGINTPASDKFVGGNAAPVKHAGVQLNSPTAPNSILSLDLTKSNWNGVCDKSSWGKRTGLIWDGVTNNNTC